MTIDYKITAPSGAWDFVVGATDIDIDEYGDIKTLSSWEKCEQDFVIAILTLYNPDDPIAPQKGSILPAMLGTKYDPFYIIPIIETQIRNSLQTMQSEQVGEDLPIDEIIDMDTVEISTNYPLFNIQSDKRVLTIFIRAKTLNGDTVSVEHPFSPPGLTESVTG